MKYLIAVVSILLMASCSPVVLERPPLGYSFLPSYLNIDSIRPLVSDDTSSVVDTSYKDYVSIAVDGGILTMHGGLKDTLPAGILISDKKAAFYVFYKASWERRNVEMKYTKYLMREYYDKAKSAEILYQNEIVRLSKAAKRSWLEQNMGYIGFILGVVTVVAIDFAILYGVK